MVSEWDWFGIACVAVCMIGVVIMSVRLWLMFREHDD